MQQRNMTIKGNTHTHTKRTMTMPIVASQAFGICITEKKEQQNTRAHNLPSYHITKSIL